MKSWRYLISIISVLLRLFKEQKPFAAAVVLLFAVALVSAGGRAVGRAVNSSGVFGGPVGVRVASFIQPALLVGVPTVVGGGGVERNKDVNSPRYVAFLDAALDSFGVVPAFPISQGNVSVHRIEKGDTLFKIAAKFGVSVQSILSANPTVNAKRLRLGSSLTIPAVSGTVYKTRDGDTLESIADFFGVPAASIMAANRSVKFAALAAGTTFIIPGVKFAGILPKADGTLPYLKGYFIIPTSGLNGGRLHPQNAIDISAICGAPVVAAAEGLVIPDDTYGDGRNGWNGGYGNFVLIEHPINPSVKTRYAHLNEVIVGVGNYIKQGQQIGTVGATGDANGCHLHFEVYGAVNPFAE